MKGKVNNRNLDRRRIAESGWKRALRTLFRLILLAGLFALVVYSESYFKITEVRVTGNSAVSPAEIIKVSGAESSRNIFTLRERKAAQLIKGKYPQFESVEVIRSLPGSVLIEITERLPVAAVMTADGYWMIDKNTFCFDFSAERDQTLPLITGLDGSIGAPGLPLDCPARAKVLREFLYLWAGKEFAELKELNLNSSYNLILHTADDMEIWLGDSSSMAEKLLLVESSLPYLQGDGHIKLDVRSGSRLIVAGSAAIRDGEVEP